nr:hypothetical protein [uncultured Pedobacter sp.]
MRNKSNGVGIPYEVQSKVFDLFFTTEEIAKGTDLGLDVVAPIEKQHYGAVKVNLKLGEIIFEVCLPIGLEKDRNPYLLETSSAGIFAVGDVRAVALNKMASATDEGSISINFVRNIFK